MTYLFHISVFAWQVRYWEQLVGHIVIFTASLVGTFASLKDGNSEHNV